jgi:hypothetical protein
MTGSRGKRPNNDQPLASEPGQRLWWNQGLMSYQVMKRRNASLAVLTRLNSCGILMGRAQALKLIGARFNVAAAFRLRASKRGGDAA